MTLVTLVPRRQPKNSIRHKTAAATAGALALAIIGGASTAQAGKYDTAEWNGKFRYGAYSTLISSHLLGREFPGLVSALNNPSVQADEARPYIAELKRRYETLSDGEIDEIIAFANADRTESIFEEERSIVSSVEENNIFMAEMANNAHLSPVDNLIQDGRFKSGNFQFNTHRALYNNAYYIPQNSLAAFVNAYIAGIRSVEFDVLESADHVNFVIHDLVTNRLDGAFSDPPKYVEEFEFKDLRDTAVDILIPIQDDILREESGVKHLMTTEHVLRLVCELMPELTLYSDARNDAPLSLIRLLATTTLGQEPCRNQLVIKIYSFTLNGGATDLIRRYAERYTRGDRAAAAQEIRAVRPNVLLALGNAEAESNEDVLMSGASGFGWDQFLEHGADLPFSRNSRRGIQPGMFTTDELREIEIRTFKMFRWAAGLAAVTNPLIFQMSAIPSLLMAIEQSDNEEIAAMPSAERLKSAAHDNFLTLYRKVMEGQLNVMLTIDGLDDVDLTATIANARFGLSDRYPDFTVARRLPDQDLADQNHMVNFVYSMLGTAGSSDTYAAKKARSTAALIKRTRDIAAVSGGAVVYATTDLPTDLRMAFMGILPGEFEDLTHRRTSLIKERYNLDPSSFALPQWSTRLSNALHQESNGFTADEKSLSAEREAIANKSKMLHSLRASCSNGLPLFHRGAADYVSLDLLAVPGVTACAKINDLEAEIDHMTLIFNESRTRFEVKHNVRFTGQRSFVQR